MRSEINAAEGGKLSKRAKSGKYSVIPAKAGIHNSRACGNLHNAGPPDISIPVIPNPSVEIPTGSGKINVIPAFAGMTGGIDSRHRRNDGVFFSGVGASG